MSTITVIYARSHSLGGLLIRARDPFGRWSHAGLVTERGTVIEALAFKGVVESSLIDFSQRYPKPSQRSAVDIECPRPDLAIAWARGQVGKGYDYRGVIGLAFREQWDKRDSWHCTELIEQALSIGGRQRFRDVASIITPNLSYMVR